ncbi:MAG: peptidoglycan DD-metalloendopeptidase family protein [Actinomycetota bacterium]|nr:peptidoglycan DD-metalloendopeptidase family protein [Actinomycetota bacterium]
MRRRRLALFVALALVPLLVWGALPLASSGSKLGRINTRIHYKQQKVDRLKSKEGVLTTDIAQVTSRITVLTRRQNVLQADLDRKKAELLRIQDDLRRTRARLARLRAKLTLSRNVLRRRLVEIYEAGKPDLVTVILNSKGFADLLERSEFLRRINDQDKQVIKAVRVARDAAKRTADHLAKLEARQQKITTEVLARRNEVASVKFGLANARAAKAQALHSVRGQRQKAQEDLAALQKEQSRIQGVLTNGANSGGAIRQGNGRFIWPVNGPITSPFCERRAWEACHPGIDIGVGSGTPIHAAGSGTVALAGPAGGYGNYTCVNHGGGISTCYAHQSAIYVSVGQNVSQGQVIGASGCTGMCFGAHLHFEVRVNGSPVNPLNYL